MMSMLCNCCVRELLILACTWFAFGLPSKTGCDSCSPVPPLEAPPAPPLGVLAIGVAAGGDPDDGGDDSISSDSTDLSEEQEPEGWVARPITRDAVHRCHFHDALNTLLR
jgi:hypothetical protein